MLSFKKSLTQTVKRDRMSFLILWEMETKTYIQSKWYILHKSICYHNAKKGTVACKKVWTIFFLDYHEYLSQARYVRSFYYNRPLSVLLKSAYAPKKKLPFVTIFRKYYTTSHRSSNPILIDRQLSFIFPYKMW